ncbi:GntP family permease [Mycoplasmatota bacterium]|nr:GntP family permease [Mycoplasmatota bacterium]
MFTGFGLVILLVITIALMIFLINKVKLHPFLAILLSAYFFALLGGVKVSDIDGVIRSGFGGLLAYIGIVIILGTIIGVILEKSGAAITMANFALKTVGKKNPTLAMGIVGWLVSIPVFCDSGYVILAPLKKSLAKISKSSMVTMTVALSVGLYASHTLVPPTPGPIAAAGNLGIENSLGLVILFGVFVSLVALTAGYIYAKFIGKRVDDSVLSVDLDDEIIEENYGVLPSTFMAFLPILLPVLLISLGTIVNLPAKPIGEGTIYQMFNFLGKPTTALLIGLFTALPLLKDSKSTFNDIVNTGIRIAAPILLITAAGGAFGAAIKATTIAGYIGDNLSVLSVGLLVPFIIAAALKTAQGSSTTALVVTSSIVAPLLPALGLGSEIGAVLTVMAIGAGAMTISHSNDSYFWVVSQTAGMDTQTAYKTHSIATLFMGIASIITTLILGLILL